MNLQDPPKPHMRSYEDLECDKCGKQNYFDKHDEHDMCNKFDKIKSVTKHEKCDYMY